MMSDNEDVLENERSIVALIAMHALLSNPAIFEHNALNDVVFMSFKKADQFLKKCND